MNKRADLPQKHLHLHTSLVDPKKNDMEEVKNLKYN